MMAQHMGLLGWASSWCHGEEVVPWVMTRENISIAWLRGHGCLWVDRGMDADYFFCGEGHCSEYLPITSWHLGSPLGPFWEKTKINRQQWDERSSLSWSTPNKNVRFCNTAQNITSSTSVALLGRNHGNKMPNLGRCPSYISLSSSSLTVGLWIP